MCLCVNVDLYGFSLLLCFSMGVRLVSTFPAECSVSRFERLDPYECAFPGFVCQSQITCSQLIVMTKNIFLKNKFPCQDNS